MADIIEGLKGMIKPKKRGEIEIEKEAEGQKTVNVKIENMGNIEAIDRIANFLRDENIVFIRSQITNLEEYKKAVEKLKKVCMAVNGDIVGIGENNLLVVPSFVKIVR